MKKISFLLLFFSSSIADIPNLYINEFVTSNTSINLDTDFFSFCDWIEIYNSEDNEKEEEKNINTVLLLEPKNEEAIYMSMKIELKRSNYSKVKELYKIFSKVCNTLCDKKTLILESLKNLEPKNES